MKYHIYTIICAAAVLSACNDDISLSPADNFYGGGEEIILTAGYPALSRATDVGFTDTDRMGIYIVDYADGKPQSLTSGKLHADNVLFTYNEAEDKWSGVTKLYWNDKTTPVDVYGYYPFDAEMTAPTAYKFSVKTNQSTAATTTARSTYEQSDLLRAKAAGVAPTSETVQLTYLHLMAGMTVKIVEGEGFSTGEWQAATRLVWISNTVTDATVNLEDGTVDVAANPADSRITPLEYNGDYRAVVVPQTLEAGKELIGITINGQNYSLKKDAAMTYTSGKMHTFTIKVDKRTETGGYVFSLIGESITSWIDDPEFHDGIVREYITVNVESPGTLEQVLKEMGLNYAEIESMKLTGIINAADREFIGRRMTTLVNLNAKDVIMEDEKIEFPGEGHITHIVYPKEHLKTIGYMGPLVGAQVLPEGVETILWGAYKGCQLYSGVEFPSTLKEIQGAFHFANYSGEIHLPEGLEIIGDGAWGHGGIYDNPNITGTLTIPQSVKYIGSNAFNGFFSGDLIIPQGIKTISKDAFGRAHFTGNLIIPEGCEVIEDDAFGNGYNRVGFKGELVLPSTVKKVGAGAFANNDFTNIVFPVNLVYLGSSAFKGCNRLTGSITIPKKISALQDKVFEGCSLLTGIVLHEDIAYIGKRAFADCNYIKSIVCYAEVPPVFEDNTFEGLSLGDITVEVPATSVALYKQDSNWKRFKRITAYSNFVCRPQQACALNSAREQIVTLNADGAWEITHKPDWCRVSQTSGTGKTSLIISIDNMARGNGDREDYVEFKLNGKNFTTRCTLTQYDYEYAEDQLLTLQKHSKGRGIKIVMLGDGWSGKDIASGDYMKLCRDEMEYFFGLPPYDRLRDYFDVYAGVALSQETGVNTPNTYLDTRFSTFFASGNQRCDANCYVPDEEEIYDYLTKDPLSFSRDDLSRGLVILIPNSTDYTGITYNYWNWTLSICPPSFDPYPSDTRGMVQHEAGGHGFGKLGDERILYNQFASNQVKQTVEEAHEKGWYNNLATTGKMNDVPWAHFIFDERYSDNVDVFEGGADYTRGIWRSETNSCMNFGIPYYNAISRQQITKRVMEAAGETFSMEDFYKNDTKVWGKSSIQNASTRAGGNQPLGNIQPMVNHAPVFVKGNTMKNRLKELRKNQKNNITR